MSDREKLKAIHDKLSSLRNEIDALEGTCRALEQEEFYLCNPECKGDFESNLTNLLL
jgi:hypothetical protein